MYLWSHTAKANVWKGENRLLNDIYTTLDIYLFIELLIVVIYYGLILRFVLLHFRFWNIKYIQFHLWTNPILTTTTMLGRWAEEDSCRGLLRPWVREYLSSTGQRAAGPLSPGKMCSMYCRSSFYNNYKAVVLAECSFSLWCGSTATAHLY